MRAACGSSRCTCDHTLCDLGWFPVTVRTSTGGWAEASRKCLECFPPVAPPPPPAPHLRDARELGATYRDHAAAAAGDKDD